MSNQGARLETVMSQQHHDPANGHGEPGAAGSEPVGAAAPTEHWELTELGREIFRMFETGALDPAGPHARAVPKHHARSRGNH
jgi:hypothetical protein